MKLRRILWLYCVFACLALVAGLIAVILTSSPLREASREAATKLRSETGYASVMAKLVSDKEEAQRAQRAQLSAEEAIKWSAQIQVKQHELEELNAARDAAQSAYNAAVHAYQNHMQRLIPLIALLILHLVGSMLLWPRPGEPLRTSSTHVRPETIRRK